MSPNPPINVHPLLLLALQHHQAGRLAEAETGYRQLLTVQPQNAEAWHHLGILAQQKGRLDVAAEWIGQAIKFDPQNAVMISNLGEVYRVLQRFNDAVAAHQRAIQIQPSYAQAHYNLANALMYQGARDEAVVAYSHALSLGPGSAEVHNNLGGILAQNGRLDEAAAAYRRALALRPQYPEAETNLGNVLDLQGQTDAALAAYQRALQWQPNHAAAHYNAGTLHYRAGNFDEAIAAFRRALDCRPDFAEAWSNLGLSLLHRGRLKEALAAARRAVELQPDSPDSHHRLGVIRHRRGELLQAVDACRHAVQLDPLYADGWNDLGITLAARRDLDGALAAYRETLRLKPDQGPVWNNLALALQTGGDWDAAIPAYRRAIELSPAKSDFLSNLIHALHFVPGLEPGVLAAEQRRWCERFGRPFPPATLSSTHDRTLERRLRIGYVSPDFRDHVVGRNLLPLFRHHDHANFEIIGYSSVPCADLRTEEFRPLTDRWHDLTGLPDETVAGIIREDRIDILVDLTQHMAGHRLGVFAREPAPVQVSFAGYPATTGLPAIPWRITDRWLEPDGSEIGDGKSEIGHPPNESDLRSPSSALQAAERLYHLDSFWCYDPCGVEVRVNELPAQTNGYITFGSLNNFCKVNPPVLELWARVLRELPSSRLLVLCPPGSHRQRTLDLLTRDGVSAHRIAFAAPQERKTYLELYHRVDIVLDTFPYNGHTTSLDALWMGVPVITLAGQHSVSRAGLSQLSNLGLLELIATSPDEYLQIATKLARDLTRLASLRATLRPRMEASVLMNAPHFAKQIETTYREMWRNWIMTEK